MLALTVCGFCKAAAETTEPKNELELIKESQTNRTKLKI